MVQNSEWGPPLWRVLHTLAERLGRQAIPMMAADEWRAWIAVLRGLEKIMPCALCKKHYREWRTAHPLEWISSEPGAAQGWLWELHEAVNERNGVAADARIPRDGLTAIYGPARSQQDFQQDVETLVEVLKRAALERAVDGAVVLEWRGKLAGLRRLIGF